METNDIYRLANDALKFIDTIDVEAITVEDEITLIMAMNKATQLKDATFRIQELLTQFEYHYEIIVNNPERYKILTNTESEDNTHDGTGEITSIDS